MGTPAAVLEEAATRAENRYTLYPNLSRGSDARQFTTASYAEALKDVRKGGDDRRGGECKSSIERAVRSRMELLIALRDCEGTYAPLPESPLSQERKGATRFVGVEDNNDVEKAQETRQHTDADCEGSGSAREMKQDEEEHEAYMIDGEEDLRPVNNEDRYIPRESQRAVGSRLTNRSLPRRGTENPQDITAEDDTLGSIKTPKDVGAQGVTAVGGAELENQQTDNRTSLPTAEDEEAKREGRSAAEGPYSRESGSYCKFTTRPKGSPGRCEVNNREPGGVEYGNTGIWEHDLGGGVDT